MHHLWWTNQRWWWIHSSFWYLSRSGEAVRVLLWRKDHTWRLQCLRLVYSGALSRTRCWFVLLYSLRRKSIIQNHLLHSNRSSKSLVERAPRSEVPISTCLSWSKRTNTRYGICNGKYEVQSLQVAYRRLSCWCWEPFQCGASNSSDWRDDNFGEEINGPQWTDNFFKWRKV